MYSPGIAASCVSCQYIISSYEYYTPIFGVKVLYFEIKNVLNRSKHKKLGGGHNVHHKKGIFQNLYHNYTAHICIVAADKRPSTWGM